MSAQNWEDLEIWSMEVRSEPERQASDPPPILSFVILYFEVRFYWKVSRLRFA